MTEQCYKCERQHKGYCLPALTLHDEKMQISGHDACEHFKAQSGTVRFKVPCSAYNLITGAKHAIRSTDGLVTVVYTDDSSHSWCLGITKKQFDEMDFIKVVRTIQEMEKAA